MKTESKQRKRLADRIKDIPDENLDSLESYMDQLENRASRNSKVLSYSGIFKDLDEEVFRDLTENLHVKRVVDDSRIP